MEHQFFCLILFMASLLSMPLWTAEANELTPMMPPFQNGKAARLPGLPPLSQCGDQRRRLCLPGFLSGMPPKETCTKTVQKEKVSLKIDPKEIQKGRHAFVGCISCHRDVARSPHRSTTGAQCRSCHPVHNGAGDIHAPHLRVRCQACHGVSKFVYLDKVWDEVRLAHKTGRTCPSVSRTMPFRTPAGKFL
jgi:hypothetical protein